MKKSIAAVACTGLLAGCGGEGPVRIDRGATCASCRMTIAEPRLAAEIVAPGEEPRLYDDIGCLIDGLERGDLRQMGDRATIYVADHRTGAWVSARDAVYTRDASLDTPMGSHLVAHADAASRAADHDVAHGVALTPAQVLDGAERGNRAR